MARKLAMHTSHFLLAARARTIGLQDVFGMSDDAADDLFRRMRWPETDGEPVCPECQCQAYYAIPARRQWRCKRCRHTFSVTSGTMFHSRKLPARIYLAAIAIYANAAKGLSALQLGRDLNVQYKTAFVLAHKLRQALCVQQNVAPLHGVVEADGGYVNYYTRPENRKEDRTDRRKAQNPRKECVLVLRQRADAGENPAACGAVRTVTRVIRQENAVDVTRIVRACVVKGSEVVADESPAYDRLAAWYVVTRINHSEAYSGPKGENTNQAESYFSRLRRMHLGQVHRLGGVHLAAYACEIAYREDTRRWPNGNIFLDILGKALTTAKSPPFCGYWRGRRGMTALRLASAA